MSIIVRTTIDKKRKPRKRAREAGTVEERGPERVLVVVTEISTNGFLTLMENEKTVFVPMQIFKATLSQRRVRIDDVLECDVEISARGNARAIRVIKVVST
jgi:hypothetical protein